MAAFVDATVVIVIGIGILFGKLKFELLAKNITWLLRMFERRILIKRTIKASNEHPKITIKSIFIYSKCGHVNKKRIRKYSR